MIPKDDAEKWMLIELHALDCLRTASSQWRGVGTLRLLFRFLSVPSFSSAAAYSFSERIEPLDGSRFYCVRTKWDRQYDKERFESSMRSKSDLEPTMDKTLITLSEDLAQPILERVKNLSLPLFVQQCGIQLDGTQFEFANGQVTLRWGDNCPTEWEPLSEMVLKLVQCVEQIETAR